MTIVQCPNGLYRIGTGKGLFKTQAAAKKALDMLQKKGVLDTDGAPVRGKEAELNIALHKIFHAPPKKPAPKKAKE